MKKIRITLILSFCIIALAFATACNEEGNVSPASTSVVGYLITEEGTPISNAIVEATDGEGNVFFSSTTNDLGGFEVMNIPDNAENGIVSFVKDGTIIKQLKLNTLINLAKKAGKADIFLNEEYDYNAVFAVKVIDNSTSAPIENANVLLTTSDKAMFEAITDATGYAYLPKIVPGRYNIYIAHNDYNTLNESLLLLFPEGMDTLSFPFSLTPKSKLDSNTGGNGNNNDSIINDTCCNNSIKIKVLRNTDTTNYGNDIPFANCKVIITNHYNKYTIEKTTDNNGWIEVADLCYGRYSIYLLEDEYEGELQLALHCSEQLEGQIFAKKKFVKCCDNVVVVLYRDKNGNPINCGTAILKATNFTREANIINGTATFKEICNDRTYHFVTGVKNCNVTYYDVSLSPNTGIYFGCKDTVERKVFLQNEDIPCCNNSIQISLTKLIIKNGNVVDSAMVEDAEVEIQMWEKNTKTFSTEARFINGAYIAEGLCTGKYTIRTVVCGVVKEYPFEVFCNDRIVKHYNIECE